MANFKLEIHSSAALDSLPKQDTMRVIMEDFKAVILHGFSNEEALAIMRAVKSLGISANQTAFATTTPTSLQWKVEYLLEHLHEEHEMMQTRLAEQKKAGR